MKINFANPDIGNFEKKNILDAFSTKWISQGPYNKKFEDKFAKILNRKFALSVSNGTAAVQLAIMSMDLNEGDEVILSTDKGKMIRCEVKGIRIAGRNTQGVRIFKLSGDEKVVSAIKIEDTFI